MGQQTGTRLNHRSAACKFPSELTRRKQLLRPRRIIVAMSLTFILTVTGLVYVLMLPPSPIIPILIPTPLQLTPHDAITIDGDADFSDTALLEGWPGDGSPENPYIIDGLEIDLGGAQGNCITIYNTRVSFTISNCNLTGAPSGWTMGMGAGIKLENVTNGELVNNTCKSNERGIWLIESDSNTVVNNTCSNNPIDGIRFIGTTYCTVVNNTCNNSEGGISFTESDFNTVTSNTCNNNSQEGIFISESDSNTVASNTCNNNTEIGIRLIESDSNTVSDNTCTSNRWGISLESSDYNTVANNTCNNNRIGICLDDASDNNVVANNTFVGNTEHDILGEYMTEATESEATEPEGSGPEVLLFIGFAGIIMLGAAWRMLSGIRKFN